MNIICIYFDDHFSHPHSVLAVEAFHNHIPAAAPDVVIYILTANEWNVVANGMTRKEIVKMVCETGTSITFPPNSPGENSVTFTFVDSGEFESVRIKQLQQIQQDVSSLYTTLSTGGTRMKFR